MSTTKKKVSTPKTVVPSPKYAIGQKVFIIEIERSYPGFILQAKVESVKTIKGLRGTMSEELHSQVKTQEHTTFEYDLSTVNGWFSNVSEWSILPTVTPASLTFANSFVHLLK